MICTSVIYGLALSFLHRRAIDKPVKQVEAPTEPEYPFVEKPSEDFYCPVTTELLLKPYLTECCGKHLSATAVVQIEGGKCPLCNDSNLTTMLDKHFQRQLRELLVFCHHRNRGCGWVAEFLYFKEHIQSCPNKDSPLSDLPLGMQYSRTYHYSFVINIPY